MNLLLKEYLISGDVSEAEHCLRDLEVPHFHHELVYEVFIQSDSPPFLVLICSSPVYYNTFQAEMCGSTPLESVSFSSGLICLVK